MKRLDMLVVPVSKNKYEVRYERSNKKVAEFKTLKEAMDFAFDIERQRWEKRKKETK